jgi:hypothetical protein
VHAKAGEHTRTRPAPSNRGCRACDTHSHVQVRVAPGAQERRAQRSLGMGENWWHACGAGSQVHESMQALQLHLALPWHRSLRAYNPLCVTAISMSVGPSGLGS